MTFKCYGLTAPLERSMISSDPLPHVGLNSYIDVIECLFAFIERDWVEHTIKAHSHISVQANVSSVLSYLIIREYQSGCLTVIVMICSSFLEMVLGSHLIARKYPWKRIINLIYTSNVFLAQNKISPICTTYFIHHNGTDHPPRSTRTFHYFWHSVFLS